MTPTLQHSIRAQPKEGVLVMVPWFDEFGKVRGWMKGTICGPCVATQATSGMGAYGLVTTDGFTAYPVCVAGRVYWRRTSEVTIVRKGTQWPGV